MSGEYLPPGFSFTQTALRTYQACPYRFRLRYLEEVPWPAFPSAPGAEAALERGRRFHELARQHCLGLEVSGQAGAAGEEVVSWWQALATAPPDLAGYPRRYPEAGLSVPLGKYRLAARYDLLAVGEGQARIVDWKTGRPLAPPEALERDLQTRVYLFTLAEGGAAYHGGRPLAADSLSLLYWHPEGPEQLLVHYSAARCEEDRAYLQALVWTIAAHPAEEMRPVVDPVCCGACAYAPLCGQSGGPVEWDTEEETVSESESWPTE